MKIYTKKGDAGETGLYGGQRVPKDHLRIRAYGALDELNAIFGLVLSEPSLATDLRERLLRIENELFQLGSELATPADRKVPTELLESPQVELLEREIDEMDAGLPPLTHFILPGGSRRGALLHLARTTSRRVEREMIALHHVESLRAEALRYMNRLSDYLFVCARYQNQLDGEPETPWQARK
ncbi:MAG: ATP:cob(I)alamin adenosyltransferase [Bdellovibrionales bacterium GWB1_55_8]|nr:MAG: ATP:cob(I)alamin adenosyltransferase [Bdellovibrionales bacterium GWB1_55_8]